MDVLAWVIVWIFWSALCLIIVIGSIKDIGLVGVLCFLCVVSATASVAWALVHLAN
jgi:hypothetical protein